MANLRELLKQREDLDRQINEAREDERTDALITVLQMIQDFQFTSQDLQMKISKLPAKKVAKQARTFTVKKSKMVHPPKYRDPASGKTWSGRGHQPHWIEGDKDDYLIKESKTNKRTTQNNKGKSE